MRFTEAWAEVCSQNIILKVTLVTLILTTIALAASTTQLALRDPFIVDRGCVTKAGTKGELAHTPAEMESFTKDALAQRFNSESLEFNFLSTEESNFRSLEQKELAQKGISQKLTINSISIEGNTALVDADRIITAGAVKSALTFPLAVTLGTTHRTQSNPYGLILVRVSQDQNKRRNNETRN